MQDKNDKGVVNVMHVKRQTVGSAVIALTKGNLVEKRNLSSVVYTESAGTFTSTKPNSQKVKRYLLYIHACVFNTYHTTCKHSLAICAQ